MMPVKRVIRFFNKEDESFAGEYTLKNISSAELRDLFSLTHQNPMYDTYEISPNIAKSINLLTKKQIEFKFDLYDYYLDYYCE